MDYEEMFCIANSMKEQIEKEFEYIASKSNNSKLDFCLLDDGASVQRASEDGC